MKKEEREETRRFSVFGAELLNLPLLVAWKYGPHWMLVDTVHFERRTAYHLTFERAMKENLMTIVCGEQWIVLDDDFSFVVDA